MSKADEVQPDKGAVVADPKDKDVKAAKPDAPAPDDKDPGDEASPGGGNDADKPKKPHWSQKRIDELTRNWRQEQREKAQLLELLRQREQEAKPAVQPQAQAATKPQPNQYQTTEEFLEALADWKAESKIQDWDRKRRTEAEENAKRESEQKRKQTFAEREAKARAKYEDYDLVALGDETPITELMAKVIYASDLGPEIAYFIGKNPDKGQQIAQMTDPAQVALAIGRIEAQVEAAATPPPAPEVPAAPKAAPTAAPPPPKTLSGSAPAQKNPEQMTTKEWMDWRNSQVRKKRA